MQPDISIVIPARNEGRRIANCLRSLREQSLASDRYEVIVVDDGSDDDTADVGRQNGARVIRQSRKGTAAARNRGIADARGEIILFTDADCIADPNWVERLSGPLERSAIHGTVGRIVTRQTHWLACFIQAELDERYSRMLQHEQVDFINSGNCGFKRSILGAGGYDESFAWIEDLELSFRLARSGNRMIFVQDAIVAHEHPQKLGVYLRRKFRYASFASMLYRRYPDKIFSDSRTPSYLRWQLALLALAVAATPFALISIPSLLFSLVCIAAAAALSYSYCRRVARKSLVLGLLAPFYAMLGNLAFAAGIVRGLFCGGRP
jgi:glycosyltransferase involved in cell wall biosynthesis